MLDALSLHKSQSSNTRWTQVGSSQTSTREDPNSLISLSFPRRLIRQTLVNCLLEKDSADVSNEDTLDASYDSFLYIHTIDEC